MALHFSTQELTLVDRCMSSSTINVKYVLFTCLSTTQEDSSQTALYQYYFPSCEFKKMHSTDTKHSQGFFQGWGKHSLLWLVPSSEFVQTVNNCTQELRTYVAKVPLKCNFTHTCTCAHTYTHAYWFACMCVLLERNMASLQYTFLNNFLDCFPSLYDSIVLMN